MPTSIMQQIINAVKTRLGTIKVAASYNSDIGLNVFEFRDTAIGDESLPCIEIRDTNTETKLLESHRHRMSLEIKIFAKDPTISTMRGMIADVLNAIGTDPLWTVSGTRLAVNTYPVSHAILEVQHKENIILCGQVNIIIEYRTGEWTPNTIK